MDKFSFICFSVNNWEKRKARKQQFMLHLSHREDVENVLYVEPPLNLLRLFLLPLSELKTFENRQRWARALKWKTKCISGKLYLFTPVFFIPFAFRVQLIYQLNLLITLAIIKLIIKRMGLRNIVLWLYHPLDHMLLTWFRNRTLAVFDWAEEWGKYFIEFSREKRKKITSWENKIIQQADIVFVVSQKLLDMAGRSNRNSFKVLDGTVHEIFRNADGYVSEDIRHIKKPVLGYLGTINERVDLDLLQYTSKKFPHASIVLIGDIHHERTDISQLKRCSNIYFLGARHYEELGDYTRHFDVCILPYKPELTFSFPTKILDYFATGKPVVSTNLVEIAPFKESVYIADSKEEFVNGIKMALEEDNSQFSLDGLNIAKENSWGTRASQIMAFVKERSHVA